MNANDLSPETNTALAQALAADLEWKLQTGMKINHGDEICGKYLIENRTRILPRLMLKQQKYGGDIADITAEFIKGVHARHESGLPLS